MAAIENLEIVVDVKITEAIASLEELQSELRDLADTINDVDARGTEGIDISTTLDDLDSELAALETELEAFEQAEELEIPVELDVRGRSRVRREIRNLDGKTARPTVDFQMGDELDDVETRLSDLGADLGLDAMEDGELSVRSMKVAAGRVTVFGAGDDENAAEAISEILTGFNVDVGEETSKDIQVDESRGTDLKKPLTGPGFLTMSSPTAADDESLREGMDMLFGDDDGPFSDIGQQLTQAVQAGEATDRTALPQDLRRKFDNLGVSTERVTEAMERRSTFQARIGDKDREGTPFEGAFEDLSQDTRRAQRLVEGQGPGGLSGRDLEGLGFDDFDDFERQLRSEMDFDVGEALRNTDLDMEVEMAQIPEGAADWEVGEHLADRMAGRPGRFGAPPEVEMDMGRQRISDMLPDFDFGGRDTRLSRMFGSVTESLGDARESISNFDLRMSDVHNAFARLVPLLFLFIGAIPAVVTAVLGLAAAAVAAAAGLAAIAGLGALGLALEDGQLNMQNLQDAIEDIKSDFIEAFAPLAERLQPLFEDALDGLTRFFEAIAQQDEALMSLTDEARAFGGFLMDFIPLMLRSMAGLADALSPIFGNIGTFLEENLNQMVASLVDLTAKAVPIVADLALTIAGMLPALVEMSLGFAQFATIVLKLVGMFGKFLSFLGLTPRLFGLLAAGALAAASAILLANSALIGFIIKGLLVMAKAVYGFFVPAVATIVSGFTSSAVATFVATAALASFLTLATLGAGLALAAAATSAAASFLGLADSIGSATSNLEEYNRVSGRTSDGPNPYGGGGGPGSANLGGGMSGGGNVTVIESNGDNEQARSQGAYASWRQGRTTGDSA